MTKENKEITIDLIKKFQNGNKEPFNKIILFYQNYVCKVALKILRSKEDAEDLTQEVFIKLYNNLQNFKFKSDLKTYLYRITVNTAYNYCKKEKRRKIKADGLSEEASMINKMINIDEKLIEEEIIDDLQRAITKLSDKHKTIINLKDFSSMPYKEIGKKLKISENAAKIRHHYALKKLKKLFIS
ncbi:MAG: RNA polymerase sigma factor [Spirochaetes bacterium]|nr:RNA polymerase sigma factor [Spirochaetota bacterium]